MQLRHTPDEIHHALSPLRGRKMRERGAVLEHTTGFKGHDEKGLADDRVVFAAKQTIVGQERWLAQMEGKKSKGAARHLQPKDFRNRKVRVVLTQGIEHAVFALYLVCTLDHFKPWN